MMHQLLNKYPQRLFGMFSGLVKRFFLKHDSLNLTTWLLYRNLVNVIVIREPVWSGALV